jgi:hypothetical protein
MAKFIHLGQLLKKIATEMGLKMLGNALVLSAENIAHISQA